MDPHGTDLFGGGDKFCFVGGGDGAALVVVVVVVQVVVTE
jgi:hypothetical protein